jgi:hypothetical protein
LQQGRLVADDTFSALDAANALEQAGLLNREATHEA